ncbi:sulfatase [Paraglaciecola chathamensis]|uniref:Sulfatase n=1 Tax=Paraglaciecola chathamensis S18K6 TaxID=1127672 RepID=A0AAV3V8Y8_9ALTE|nr:sulfatase [Paraglaciecola chathamensis]GAC12645.1 sulfatase [Paraglaciecola chathamensis S18K6]
MLGLKGYILSVVLVCLGFACKASNETSESRATKSDSSVANQQNIVMIIVDDLRPALGVYGDDKAHTPNIDSLAFQGVSFNQAYANVPVCGASRASFLTGLRPQKNRFIDYKALAEKDAPGAKSLPQIFRENGYQTMAVGKIFHHARDLADESWSEGVHTSGIPHTTSLAANAAKLKNDVPSESEQLDMLWFESADVEDEDYPDGKVKDKALDAISLLAAKKEPFFLSVGFIRPHLPFYAPTKYYDLHPLEKFSPFSHRTTPDDAPSSLRGSGEIKTYSFSDYVYNSDVFHTSSLRGYYASISYVDALVGDVVEQLTSLNLRESTTIILLSDHGFHLGEHNFWTKHTLLKTALRVPLIISGPNTATNVQSNALLELIDIFPTVLDLAKIPKPEGIDGESFESITNNPLLEHKKQIYSRFKKGDSIITSDSIFTLYDLGTSKEEMLFDLIADPHETQNLASESEYQNRKTKLKTMLLDCKNNSKCVTH